MDFDSITDLADWSVNYNNSSANPFNFFCDLIGYSKERFGDDLCNERPDLGYIELCKLSDALSVFENNGYPDVYKYIDMVLSRPL